MPRTIQTLTEGWGFALGTEKPRAFAPVRIPHDWVVGRAASPEADPGQGYIDRGGVGWYRTLVTLPNTPGARHFLDFDGVMENSAVWVNGREVGGHGYGYSCFRLEVTAAARPGENEVLVRADCTAEPADRWYSGAGLYRPVRWLTTGPAYLDEREVVVRAAFEDDDARVTLEPGFAGPVEAVLRVPDGAPVARASGTGALTLRVPAALRWSAETPALYALTLRLPDGSDEVTLRIGLREARFTPDGLYVNGARTVLKGVCLHQDMGCRGLAADPARWRQRLLTLKEMGCNAIRAAHHMHSAAFMDLCDELGFYVYEEAFDKWHSGAYHRYFADWRADLDAMLKRDRNRPSVLLWGVGNEVESQGQPSMLQTLAQLTDYVRAADPTRPVTYAMNPHFKRPADIDPSQVKDIQALVDEVDELEIDDLDEKLARMALILRHVDVIACNYQEQWYPRIHALAPEKPVLGTEVYQYFMGDPGHYQNYTEAVPSLVPLTTPYVVGGMIWAGYDYLGESMGWPSRGWTGALIRANGDRRASYYLHQSYWTSRPMVYLAVLDYSLGDELAKEHWDFPPYEAHWDFPAIHKQPVPFLIATNCERVLVYAGGREFAPPLPSASPNRLITGYLPYVPGTVEVRGYNGDREVCRYALRTPGPAVALAFDPAERPTGGDELLLTVRATDAAGTPTRREDRAVTFRVEGPAELLGTENGNLMAPVPADPRTLSLWRGQASVALRLTGEPGPVRVRATADGLAQGELTIA